MHTSDVNTSKWGNTGIERDNRKERLFHINRFEGRICRSPDKRELSPVHHILERGTSIPIEIPTVGVERRSRNLFTTYEMRIFRENDFDDSKL
jgi:hypothetical protein